MTKIFLVKKYKFDFYEIHKQYQTNIEISLIKLEKIYIKNKLNED